MKRPAMKRERTTCRHCGNTNAELVMAHVYCDNRCGKHYSLFEDIKIIDREPRFKTP